MSSAGPSPALKQTGIKRFFGAPLSVSKENANSAQKQNNKNNKMEKEINEKKRKILQELSSEEEEGDESVGASLPKKQKIQGDKGSRKNGEKISVKKLSSKESQPKSKGGKQSQETASGKESKDSSNHTSEQSEECNQELRGDKTDEALADNDCKSKNATKIIQEIGTGKELASVKNMSGQRSQQKSRSGKECHRTASGKESQYSSHHEKEEGSQELKDNSATNNLGDKDSKSMIAAKAMPETKKAQCQRPCPKSKKISESSQSSVETDKGSAELKKENASGDDTTKDLSDQDKKEDEEEGEEYEVEKILKYSWCKAGVS